MLYPHIRSQYGSVEITWSQSLALILVKWRNFEKQANGHLWPLFVPCMVSSLCQVLLIWERFKTTIAQPSLSELFKLLLWCPYYKVSILMVSWPKQCPCYFFFLCWMNYFSGIRDLFIATVYFAASCRTVISFHHGYNSQDLYYKGNWKGSALEYIVYLSESSEEIEEGRFRGLE